jgi:hypothetical protein
MSVTLIAGIVKFMHCMFNIKSGLQILLEIFLWCCSSWIVDFKLHGLHWEFCIEEGVTFDLLDSFVYVEVLIELVSFFLINFIITTAVNKALFFTPGLDVLMILMLTHVNVSVLRYLFCAACKCVSVKIFVLCCVLGREALSSRVLDVLWRWWELDAVHKTKWKMMPSLTDYLC